MSGGDSEGRDQGDERERESEGTRSRRTRGKGSSTDSRGGRGDSDDDGADDFVDEPDSPQAQAAQETLNAIAEQVENELANESTESDESRIDRAGTTAGGSAGDMGATSGDTAGGTQTESTSSISGEFTPDEVPDIRQGTDYESFTSEQMAKSAAHAIQENNIDKQRWSEWNDFFDHMTDAELEEAASKAVSKEIERDGFGSSPEDYEDHEPEIVGDQPSLGRLAQGNLSSCLTRIGRDNPDRQREAANRLIEEAPDDDKIAVAEAGAMWCHSADVRREIYQEQNLESEANNPQRFEMQFADDHEERARTFISNYVGSTTRGTTQVARASLREYGPNKDSEISAYNGGLATESIEPTEEFRETIDRLRKQTADYIEDEHDGEVTLMRGLNNPVSSHASAESWTTSYQTASDFDGHAIMEATFRPGQVIATNEIDEQHEWGYNIHSSEEEWTVLGGPPARNVPDDMKPGEYFGKSDNINSEPRDIE